MQVQKQAMPLIPCRAFSFPATSEGMLIRNHISAAKRLLRRTIESLKSLSSKHDGSSSYRKLPKGPIMTTQVCKKRDGSEARLEAGVQRAADPRREVRMRTVAKRLKEMEMADKGNADHLLDIEEVFYYYSRLTCPSYVEIVDLFLADLQAEFVGAMY